jgi:hypothetical protein
VPWYGILCDFDDVDAEIAETLFEMRGWVDVSSDAKRDFAKS